jgi:hypothetical protein
MMQVEPSLDQVDPRALACSPATGHSSGRPGSRLNLKNGGTLEKAAAMTNPCVDAHDAAL